MATLVQTDDLAGRADFRLGGTLVRPASRELHGVGGKTSVEPRVMQVLLALADAAGEVVTRSQLIDLCWNNQVVGEDALTRAIVEVRKLARTIAGGEFAVETITKTGYRLTGVSSTPARITTGAAPDPLRFSRRAFLASAALTSAALAFVAWRATPSADQKRAAALVDRASIALRDGLPDSEAQGLGFLREAVVLDPENPNAWGKLALAWSGVAEHAGPAETASAVAACEAAARRALALDPRQADAHAALALLVPWFGAWAEAERRFQAALAIAPDHPALLVATGVLMAEVGRMKASSRHFERAMLAEPLSPVIHFRRTFHFWNRGDIGGADRNIDRALQLWPRHPAVWNTRLLLFAFTGRPRAAAAMLDEEAAGRPQTLPPPAIELWRVSLAALASRRPDDIVRAVDAQLAAVRSGGPAAINAIMVLTQLGRLDEAFAVAEGYLLRRGPLIGRLRTGPDQMPVNDQRRRKTTMLFTAATAALRPDRRFARLCEEVGLAEYWRTNNVGPDHLRGRVPALIR